MISDIRPDNRPFYSIILYPAILVSDIRLFSYPMSGQSDIQYLAILVSDIRLFSYPISGHSDIQYLVILISDIRLFSYLAILISNIRPEIQSFCYPASGRIFGNSDIRYPAILISGYSDIRLFWYPISDHSDMRYPAGLSCGYPVHSFIDIQFTFHFIAKSVIVKCISMESLLPDFYGESVAWFLWRVCCLIFMQPVTRIFQEGFGGGGGEVSSGSAADVLTLED